MIYSKKSFVIGGGGGGGVGGVGDTTGELVCRWFGKAIYDLSLLR